MLAKYRYHFFILGTALSFSSLSVISKILTDQNVPPFMQVFGRVFIALLICSFLAFGVFRQKFTITSKELSLLFLNAILFTGGYVTLSLSIYFSTSIAKAVALMYSYPLVVVLANYLIFKELPSIRQFFSIILSSISVTILLEIWEIRNLNQIGVGEMMALLNSCIYGLMIVYGRKLRLETKLHPYKTISYTLLFVLPMLLLLASLLQYSGTSILSPNITYLPTISILTLIAIAFLSTVLPFGFFYFGIEKVKPQAASILLLTEPVWVTLWGFFLFGQTLSSWGIMGIIGIIIAVLLV